MKDRIFIGWSGSNTVALIVKSILEKKYNYLCYIGGNADNSSVYSSVGDTVIRQIKDCNQAIIIFQNKANGEVSNNLFFELGYVLSSYGTKKVHCVKRADETVVLPSDFDSAFVGSIDYSPASAAGGAGTPDSDAAFAEGIVVYFLGRQKMSVNENKMFLINNRYMLHDKIVLHYSQSGSKCSDYELAQYILFYMQAAHMFGDVDKVNDEIVEFKKKYNFDFSPELALAVNICLSFFYLVLNIKTDEKTSETYIEPEVFWNFINDSEEYLKEVEPDDVGIFNEWANIFLYSHLPYAYMLFENYVHLHPDKNREEEVKEMCAELNRKGADYARKCLTAIEELEEKTNCKENNDESGILTLLRAYVYRNLFLAERNLGGPDAEKWLDLTRKARISLKKTFGNGSIDTLLYNNFQMEYYLSCVDYFMYSDNVNTFEREMCRREMDGYLKSVKKNSGWSVYLKQIEQWCNHTK